MVGAMLDFSPLMDALQLTNDRRSILFSGLSSGVRAEYGVGLCRLFNVRSRKFRGSCVYDVCMKYRR